MNRWKGKVQQRCCFRAGFWSVLVIGWALLDSCAHGASSASEATAEARRIEPKLPSGFQAAKPECIEKAGPHVRIRLYARSFSQGSAVYAEISPAMPAGEEKPEVTGAMFDGTALPLSECPWGQRILFGIPPTTPIAQKFFTATYRVGKAVYHESVQVKVKATAFEYHPRPMDVGKYSDLDYRPSPEEERFIAQCAAKKKRAFAGWKPDLLVRSFSHPRDMHVVTSTFWAQRFIMRYRVKNGRRIHFAPKRNIHRGIDLRGAKGDPVYAMADGVVVIAEPMYYEGNFVVIDHGQRFFTYYMHLDQIKVKEGDRVTAGTLIGRVGTTGLSTAAHLHVSAVIRDVDVDPMSLLMLPVRY